MPIPFLSIVMHLDIVVSLFLEVDYKIQANKMEKVLTM